MTTFLVGWSATLFVQVHYWAASSLFSRASELAGVYLQNSFTCEVSSR